MSQTPAHSRQKDMRFSIALYRRLLVLYPAAFRRAYGAQMAQVFRDNYRQAQQERGLPGILALWLATLADLLRSALAEHLSEGTIMSRSFFLRLSGLLTLVGIVVTLALVSDDYATNLIAGYRGITHYLTHYATGRTLFTWLSLIPSACRMIGLAGLLLAQRGWVGRLSASLALLIQGATLTTDIIMLFPIAQLEGDVVNIFEWTSALGWGFFQADGLLLGVALIVCGVVTLKAHLLPQWNLIPLLLGLWLVYDNLTVSYWLNTSPMAGIGSIKIVLVPVLSVYILYCLWGCLGYALWGKQRPKQAVPAVQARPSVG